MRHEVGGQRKGHKFEEIICTLRHGQTRKDRPNKIAAAIGRPLTLLVEDVRVEQ